MHRGRENEPFITFPYLYAPPPPLPWALSSCLVLPSPSSDSKLLISSSSLLTYTLINCVLILIMRSSRVGPWRGRSIGTTPITPHDVDIILHALHSKCRWFILSWQILCIFGNVLEWKNVFSVHSNFVISEEIFFAIFVIIIFK
jgi:hypothetical protein